MSRYCPELWGGVLLVMLPAVFSPALAAGGTGTDEQAAGLIKALAPDYQPWVSPLLGSPESGMETWLFALQAALGIGVIGYCLIVKRRRSRTGKRGNARVA